MGPSSASSAVRYSASVTSSPVVVSSTGVHVAPHGWWEQPAYSANVSPWTFHQGAFGRAGNAGGNMEVYDVNGDKLPDIVTALAAHGFGLVWYEQKRGANGAIQTTTNPLWIGGNQPYGEYFQGLIDEVRVYNRALTAADIQADMNTSIVPTAPDTTPPSAPSAPSAAAAGATQVNVSWTASTDNSGVAGYRVERCQGATCTDFVEVATPTGTTYNNTGLAPATTYRYRIRAAGGFPSTGVHVNNQFGQQSYVVSQRREFCVPSLKNGATTTTSTSSSTSTSTSTTSTSTTTSSTLPMCFNPSVCFAPVFCGPGFCFCASR